MDDLSELRAAPVPRPDALAERLAHRVEPTWGLVLLGFIFYLVVANQILLGGIVGSILLHDVLGFQKTGSSGPVFVITLVVVLQVPTWWLFAIWIRRKRAQARALIRDGSLLDSQVVGTTSYRGTTWYRLDFQHDGQKHHVRCPLRPLEPGDAPVVLFHPASRYALGFDRGKGVVCRAH